MADYSVAVIADIHGNLDALQAVLADLATQQFDLLVIAGDLIVNGPKPVECLTRVRALNAPTLQGNTEVSLLEAASGGGDPYFRWWRVLLTDNDLEYVASLPLQYRVTPPGGASPEDDLLIVHANPTDTFGVIITEPHPLGTSFTEPTPEDEVAELLGDAKANCIVYGHIHYASSGIIRGRWLTSIGSAGFPYDGDPRAAWALVTWDGMGWRVEHRRVAYDHLTVAEELLRSDAPYREITARRIKEANWIPME